MQRVYDSNHCINAKHQIPRPLTRSRLDMKTTDPDPVLAPDTGLCFFQFVVNPSENHLGQVNT